MPKPSKSPFRFHISGDLEDFAAFCAIIRGDVAANDSVLQALTEKLKASTSKLKAAADEAASSHIQERGTDATKS